MVWPLWKTIWQFLIVKYTFTIGLSNLPLKYLTMRNENMYLHKNLYVNVYTRVEETELRILEAERGLNLQGKVLETTKLHEKESTSNLQSSDEYWSRQVCEMVTNAGGKATEKTGGNNHQNTELGTVHVPNSRVERPPDKPGITQRS